jgi:hypothetical protein
MREMERMPGRTTTKREKLEKMVDLLAYTVINTEFDRRYS